MSPSRRAIAWMNLVVPAWFAALYLAMSARRPEYSHFTDAISELGSLDAPDRWVWNVFGYLLPGLAIALLGVAMRGPFAARPTRSLVAAGGLAGFGLLMALSGVFPADMSDFSSTTTRLHLVGAMGSYVAFLVAGFSFPNLFASRPAWAWAGKPSLALVWLSIASGFLRYWGDMPGLGQRVTFLIVFLWIGLVSLALLRATRIGTAATISREHP